MGLGEGAPWPVKRGFQRQINQGGISQEEVFIRKRDRNLMRFWVTKEPGKARRCAQK
jgi:hypothetical protein